MPTPADEFDPAAAAALLHASDPELRLAAFEAMAPREVEAVLRYELTHPETGYLVAVPLGDGSGVNVYFPSPVGDREAFRHHFAVLESRDAIRSMASPIKPDGPEWAVHAAAGYPAPERMYAFVDDLVEPGRGPGRGPAPRRGPRFTPPKPKRKRRR